MRGMLSAAGAATMCLCLVANTTSASDVVIRATGENVIVSENAVNDFYNSQPGITSSIFASIATGDLNDASLLFLPLPGISFEASEVAAIDAFVDGGGTLLVTAEGSGFPSQNGRVSSLLAALGSTITLLNTGTDGGFQTATVANGQIVSDPLTAGVDSFNYAYGTQLSVGSGSELFLLTDLTPLAAYENIGDGRVIVFGDSNAFEIERGELANADNTQFLLNLLVVPEPTSTASLLIGGCLVGLRRFRRSV